MTLQETIYTLNTAWGMLMMVDRDKYPEVGTAMQLISNVIAGESGQESEANLSE